MDEFNDDLEYEPPLESKEKVLGRGLVGSERVGLGELMDAGRVPEPIQRWFIERIKVLPDNFFLVQNNVGFRQESVMSIRAGRGSKGNLRLMVQTRDGELFINVPEEIV